MALTAIQKAIEAAKATANKSPVGSVPATQPTTTATPYGNPVAYKPQTTGGSVPIAGPMLPGVTRPTGTPVSAAAAATPTAAPQNGTLQGPYPNPSGGIQQGANVVNGQIQYNQPVSAGQANTAASSNQGGYPGMLSAQQINAEAAARIAKQRAAIEGAVTSGKTARTNLYDYTNKTTSDSRVLGDFGRTQTADVFNGRTGFQEGLIGRQREMDDTFTKSNYTNDINTLDNQLTSFDTLAPEQQQNMINEMTRLERQYGLELGSLMGSINGQKTAAQSNADRNFDQSQQQIDYSQNPNNPANIGQGLQNQGQAQQNLLNQYKIDDYPAEQKANATKIQQDLQTGKMNLEAAEYNLKQLKDPNSAVNQAAKIDLQLKQIDLKNAPETAQLKLQQLQKEIAQIGVVHYKPQTAAEIEQDQLQIRKLTAEVNKLENPSSENVTVEDYAKKYLDGLAKYDSEGVVTNGAAMESQILSSGKTEAEMRQMYARFNLKWGD